MSTGALRHPAVAGRFYPADPEDLREEARRLSLTSHSAQAHPPIARPRLHCPACGLHVFRSRCRSGFCADRDSSTLHCVSARTTRAWDARSQS